MNHGKKEHLTDFQKTVTGEYIYCGSLYIFQGSTAQWKALMVRLSVLAAICVGAELVCGCIAAPGSFRCAYVLLPTVGALLSGISLAWGLVRLLSGGMQLRRYIYDATVARFSLRTGLTAGFSAAAIAGELVYVARHGTQSLLSGMVIFLLCQAAAFGCALLWRRYATAANWRPTEPRPS